VAGFLELQIREALGSGTGYIGRDFPWFTSVPPGELWNSALNCTRPSKFTIYKRPPIQHYMPFIDEKASLN